MARLPTPGSDTGVWGQVLNDFLLTEHNPDGSLKIRNEPPTGEPAIAPGLATQYWRGDKTWQPLNQATVGLSNVDNTSDNAKPISLAAQAALDVKVNTTGSAVTGDFTFSPGAGNVFGASHRNLRYDTGEGKLWLAAAADNEILKLTYGGASGYLQIDQYGYGEVARFGGGAFRLRGTMRIQNEAGNRSFELIQDDFQSRIKANNTGWVLESANFSDITLEPSGGNGNGKLNVTAKLEVNSNSLRITSSKTPSSSSDTGNTGDIAWDADYMYVCVAPNTWKRSPLSAW